MNLHRGIVVDNEGKIIVRPGRQIWGCKNVWPTYQSKFLRIESAFFRDEDYSFIDRLKMIEIRWDWLPDFIPSANPNVPGGQDRIFSCFCVSSCWLSYGTITEKHITRKLQQRFESRDHIWLKIWFRSQVATLPENCEKNLLQGVSLSHPFIKISSNVGFRCLRYQKTREDFIPGSNNWARSFSTRD